MRKILTSSVAALALTATVLGTAAPAEAQRWHGRGGYYGGYRGHYHGGGGAGWAVGAGLLGLAAGAAIASDRGHYGYAPVYGYAPGYYAPPPAYYYAPPPVYCRADWRWDGWAHRYVRVRYCD